MSDNLSVQACAELVFRGDKERFRATMAAPVSARTSDLADDRAFPWTAPTDC
jgi:hypothetical protein